MKMKMKMRDFEKAWMRSERLGNLSLDSKFPYWCHVGMELLFVRWLSSYEIKSVN